MNWETLSQPVRIEPDLPDTDRKVRSRTEPLSEEEKAALASLSPALLQLVEAGQLARTVDHTGGYFIVPR